MKKAARLTLLSFIVFTLINSCAFSATATQKATIPKLKLILNGSVYDNQYCNTPILSYKQVLYLPISEDFGNHLGIRTTKESNITFVGTSVISVKGTKIKTVKQKNKATCLVTIPDHMVYYNNIEMASKNKTSKYPVIQYKKVIYMPLTWDNVVNVLDWKFSTTSSTMTLDSKNANRPIIEDWRLYSQSMGRGMGSKHYVYDKETYAGYPGSTMDGEYSFIYKKRGEKEIQFSLETQLLGADYYFNYFINKDHQPYVDKKFNPVLKDSFLTLACNKGYVKDGIIIIENTILTIDLVNQSIIDSKVLSTHQFKLKH